MVYLYIPGLGDRYDWLRRLGLSRWARKKAGVSARLVPMRWANRGETYEEKRARVVAAIAAVDAAEEITLVGESAGGSMALAVFHEHSDRIKQLVTVCGKNHGASTLSPHYTRTAPAFPVAVAKANAILTSLTNEQCSRIRVLYSSGDHVVGRRDSEIPGAELTDFHIRGHFRAIAHVILSPSKLIW